MERVRESDGEMIPTMATLDAFITNLLVFLERLVINDLYERRFQTLFNEKLCTLVLLSPINFFHS